MPTNDDYGARNDLSRGNYELPNLNVLFPEGKKIEINGNIYTVLSATTSVVKLIYYCKNRRNSNK